MTRISFRQRLSVGLALALLTTSACQEAPQQGNTTAAATAQPKPGEPGYIAEDSALAKLVGQPAPAMTLDLVDGGVLDLATLYGEKPVYLKLWATYCIPCRVQMPGFEAIQQKLGTQMHVVAINAGVGDDPDKVRAFVRKAGLTMPNALDDGTLGSALGLEATPLHVLIGRDGRIAHVGHQDGPALDAAIRRVLDAKPVGAPVPPKQLGKPAAITAGERVPDLRVGPQDARVPLLERDGRKHILVFFGTWCESYLAETEPATVAACRKVRTLADAGTARGDAGWQGVATHMWTEAKDLPAYTKQTGSKLPLAFDADGSVFRAFVIRRVPAIALIDAQGRYVRLLDGNAATLEREVQDFLKTR